METLIVHPRNKEQLEALKAFKIGFNTAEESESSYSTTFAEKMSQSEADVKAGRTTVVKPADIWNLD